MRRHSSIILLSILVLASACSKSNYARVEPDDLYFTHKDRKEAASVYDTQTSTIIADAQQQSALNSQAPTDYSSQHAPVLTTPTISSQNYGSPTIQQYGQQPYYDTSVNPDYLTDQNYNDLGSTSSEYYVEDYVYDNLPVQSEPVIINNYYGNGANPYYSMLSAYYSPAQFRSWSFRYGFYSRRDYFSYYGYNDYFGYSGFGDPFASLYSPYYYSSRYYGACGLGLYSAHGQYPNYYNGYNSNYYSGNYSNHNPVDQSLGNYANGTEIVDGPRRSRSSVSYYANKDNTPIKTRRDDYMPATQESGRVATSRTQNSTNPDVQRAEYSRRGNSTTYTANKVTNSNRTQDGPSSMTVQQYRNNTDKTRTVIVPTKARNGYSRTAGVQQNRTVVTNNAGQSYRQPVSRSRYTAPANVGTRSSNSTRSSYTPSRNNSSRSSYSSGSSSPSRSSYTPSRSSTPSRSVSTPSRSSSSSRSTAPTRSTSSSSTSSKKRN